MSKRTLTPTQVNAAKDVVEAIRKAIISEKKINDGITKANSLVRGFSDRKKTKALRVLIAIENFLYKEPSPDHRIYEKGLVLLYKEEGRNEEYANLIEQKGLKGGDVARAVEEFLKKEKLQEPTEQEVEKELRLKKAGVGEAARGQQIILMAEDIEQEDVTRALKGIAADIERLAQEDKKKLENAEYNRTFNELLSKKREEYDRRGGKREKNSINGDGDDNESVKSRGVKPYDTKLETPLGGPRNRSNSVSSGLGRVGSKC